MLARLQGRSELRLVNPEDGSGQPIRLLPGAQVSYLNSERATLLVVHQHQNYLGVGDLPHSPGDELERGRTVDPPNEQVSDL